jgi:beta-N-acetylhexosaminidase
MADRLRMLCGRMLMVGFRGAEPGDPLLEANLASCREAGVGAVVLFDRDLASGGEPRSRNIVSPEQLIRLTGRIRDMLGPDVWIAVDQEGGRVARLNETNGHDRGESPQRVGEMTATQREAEWDRQAAQLARAGIDWNLAPGVDLHVSGSGSLIERSGRSFGREAEAVGSAGACCVRRFARAGVASCLKHFPGHGSAPGDSHDDLLDITGCHTGDEIAAFRVALSGPDVRDRAALMTAHLLHRGVDPNWPVSLSPTWHRRIREDLHFGGVILTDALDMGAISRRFESREAMIHAVNAGADMLLLANNMPDRRAEIEPADASEHLAKAVRDGAINGGEARIEESLRRIKRFRAAF